MLGQNRLQYTGTNASQNNATNISTGNKGANPISDHAL
jgi:hypothetical protein